MKQYNQNIDIRDNKVVLKFSASWCVWCKRLNPLLNGIEEKYPDISFIEVDIDQDETLFNQYHLEVVPTLLFLNNGDVKDSLVNPQSIALIEERLDILNGN